MRVPPTPLIAALCLCLTPAMTGAFVVQKGQRISIARLKPQYPALLLASPSEDAPEPETTVTPVLMSSSPEPYWCYWSTVYELGQAGMVGAFTGLTVAVFKLSIEAVRSLSYEQDIWVSFPTLEAALPAMGGVIVGLLLLLGGAPYPPGLRGVVQEVDENETPSPLEQLKIQANFARKSAASVATLGTGNSLGPEGPCVEIGINVARAATSFNRPVPSREAGTDTQQPQRGWNRVLLSCGAAAGVAAGFNAPLAGVFFALEIMQTTFAAVDEDSQTPSSLMQSFTSTTTITPILIASVLSALTSKYLLGDELVLRVTQFNLETPLVELPLYLALGVLSGGVAFTFTYLAKICSQFFNGEWGAEPIQQTMKSIPNAVKPVIGGLICGLVGLLFPQVLFFGYGTLNGLLKDSNLYGLDLIASLLGVKLVVTAIAAGSGLVGGTFAPSLFLGAMLGALFHDGAAGLLDALQPLHDLPASAWGLEIASVPAYAMVGAASVLAALFRAPLTASLLLFEITRNYDVILPLMASAGVGSIVGDLLEDTFERREEMQRRDRDPVSWGDLSFEKGLSEKEVDSATLKAMAAALEEQEELSVNGNATKVEEVVR